MGTYIIIGVLLVGMIVLMFVQGNKQKKAQTDYMSMLDTLRVGTKVKMASGLLGRIKEIREEAPGFKTILIETGDAKNSALMTFVIEAVQGIVNEEAINKLNLQKASEQIDSNTTTINGEAVSDEKIDAESYVEKRNTESKKKTKKSK